MHTEAKVTFTHFYTFCRGDGCSWVSADYETPKWANDAFEVHMMESHPEVAR